MATQVQDQMCDNLVRKVTRGEPLDDAEKSHLASCEGCMAEVIRTLDESAARKGHDLDKTARETNGELTRTRPEAKKALEQGRRVFEREFGITLSRE